MSKQGNSNETVDSLDSALERQINLAGKVREDMRRLAEESFRDAMSPLLAEAERRVNESLKGIEALEADIKALPGSVKALLEVMASEQVQGLRRAELSLAALSDKVCELVVVRDRVEAIGDLVSSISATGNDLVNICSRVQADIASLNDSGLPEVARSIDTLPGMLEASAASTQKAVSVELEARVRVLTDQVEHLTASVAYGLARQRWLAWAAIAACGLMLPLILWIALRGM